jgi:type II secretory pathway predicted ATPase ExeA
MYESFFECRRRPFAAAPQVECYYAGRTIEAARQSLERCIERAEGTAIVAGPAGTGKTLLAATLAAKFRERFSVATLAVSGLNTRRAFLQAVLYELGLPFRGLEEGELRLSLVERLTGPAGERPLLLILDDAHVLPVRLLEETRMLADLARRGEPSVRIVLVGAASLEDRLTSPRLAGLAQRITARCYLEPLDRNDSLGYIRHQIATAGGDPTRVFTEAALEAIVRATDGIPRLINQTCDHALMLACAGGVKPIDTAGIEEAWADLQQLPTPWSQVKGYAAPAERVAPPTPLPRVARPSAPAVETPAASELPPSPPSEVIEFGTLSDDTEEGVDEALNVIETQLAEWESDFTPTAKSEPEVELRFDDRSGDPFCEDFVEEEVVVDRYAANDRLRTAPRVPVYAPDAKLLSTLFETQQTLDAAPQLRVKASPEPAVAVAPKPVPAAPAAPAFAPSIPISDSPTPHARFAKQSDPVEPEDLVIVAKRSASGDGDMIILEDEPAREVGRAPEATIVRKQDYRQMFARLRRGS